MRPGSTLDAAIELARLVPSEELAELVDAVRRSFGTTLAIYEPGGVRLAGDPAAGPPACTVEHIGEPVARLAATGPHADAAMAFVADAMGLLVHHAHARELAAATHEEAMRLTFAELTEHNQRLSRAVARLEELDRLKSNFLATMSHELRTPLTSVIGYAEMMAEGLAGPVTTEQRDYLTTILGKADQLLGLITAVLDVASLESGNFVLERGAVPLTDIVASEVASIQPQAGRRGISILARTAGDFSVVGDRKKIRQVVASLLSNAVKFSSDDGTVAIELRAGSLGPGPLDHATAAIQLVVTDSGIGISGEEVAKIFEPFFQVDSSSTRAFGGTGLGLTLAKAYVEAHGGRIWVDTAPGQGATFVATFPATPEPSS